MNEVLASRLQGALPASAPVVVIGGGVNGASTAFQLAKRGVKGVVLLERRQLGAGATGKSGALVRCHYSNVPETRLTLESMKVFKHWGDEVGAGDPRFETTGFLRVVAPDDVEKLRKNVESHQAIGVETCLVSAEEIRDIEPLMRTDDITHAAYEPGSGYADPNATLYGFVEAAVQRGAIVRPHVEATRIVVEGGKITGVETTAGRIATEQVVLAGGAWADRLLTPLGVDLPLEPHRVQVVLFRWPAEMDQRRKHAVVIDSTEHSWLRTEGAASTLIGIEHDPVPVDPDALKESVDEPYIDRCRAALARRLPVFAHATMRGSWSGVVMQSADSHPIIDRIDAVPGLFLMAGDSGTSFKTAPGIGICLAEWVTEGAPKLMDLTPFRASRFAEGAPWTDEWAYAERDELTISR